MEHTNKMNRKSPVTFSTQPMKTYFRDGWEVVHAYADEGQGPFLVDLSHRPKWDVQHASLSTLRPWMLMFPEAPGQCRLESGRLLNRMNHSQAAIWHLVGNEAELIPEPFFTDITDGLCLLALVGEQAFSVMEKVSPLDLASPGKTPPFLVQGPVLHIPCQVVVLARKSKNPIVLTAFSRGYGQSMAETFLDAGAAFGLRPGGENVFRQALEQIYPGDDRPDQHPA